jgi:LuxR family transcriptional regulator, maltose regulon positive regulatory protein
VARPWHLPLHAVDGWARVWRGDRAGAEAAMERASAIYRQFRGIRLMSERFAQFRTLLGGVSGDLAAMDLVGREMIAGLQAAEVSAHRAVWERAYRHAHARMHWIHGNIPVWQALTVPLLAPRMPVEWPFIDVAAQVVRGQRALVERDWSAVASVLEPILEDHARLRLPMIYCDPRISLAYARLRAGKASEAWQVFEPVFTETTQRFGMGLLLLDSRVHVGELLDAAPATVRASTAMQHLRGVLQQWSVAAAAPTAAADEPAGPLSEREREVLDMVASGASNKHIARSLDLSLHTVKRHICNILDKLDCDSRGQAADLYRRKARA